MDGFELNTYFSNPVNILCDVILLIVFLIFVIHSVKRGFIYTAFKIMKPIGALLLAFFACKTFGLFLYNIHILDGLVNVIKESILNIVNAEDFAAAHEGQTFTGFSGIIGMLLSLSGNEEIASQISGLVTGNEEVVTSVAQAIVKSAATVVAFAILFIFGRLIMALLGKLLDLIFKLPGLNFVNKIIGFIFGIVEGFCICWLASFILYFLCNWLGNSVNIPFFAAFGNGSNTLIENFLFHFNPLEFALKSLADSMVFTTTPTT